MLIACILVSALIHLAAGAPPPHAHVVIDFWSPERQAQAVPVDIEVQETEDLHLRSRKLAASDPLKFPDLAIYPQLGYLFF